MRPRRRHRHARRQRRRPARARGRPGPGRLYLCVNRGSEVFEVGRGRARSCVDRREATPEEDAALDAAAPRRRSSGSRARGLEARDRLAAAEPAQDRPDPASRSGPIRRRRGSPSCWPRSRRGCAAAGSTGLREAVELAQRSGARGRSRRSAGDERRQARRDRPDRQGRLRRAGSFAELARRGIGPGLVLIAGDEFGPLGGLPGQRLAPARARGGARDRGLGRRRADRRAARRRSRSAAARSASCALLEDQLERRRRGDVPERRRRPRLDARRRRARSASSSASHESLLTLADGRIGTRGAPLFATRRRRPAVLAAGVYDGEGAETELAPCPVWTRLAGELAATSRALRRRLDLRHGLLRQERDARRHAALSVLVARAARHGRAARAGARRDARLAAPVGGARRRGGRAGRARVARRPRRGGRASSGSAAYGVARPKPGATGGARRGASEAGFERLLGEHRAAWAQPLGGRPTSSSRATTSCSARSASRSST